MIDRTNFCRHNLQKQLTIITIRRHFVTIDGQSGVQGRGREPEGGGGSGDEERVGENLYCSYNLQQSVPSR